MLFPANMSMYEVLCVINNHEGVLGALESRLLPEDIADTHLQSLWVEAEHHYRSFLLIEEQILDYLWANKNREC